MPLAVILESVEAGNLTPEKVDASTQAALFLMGNAHHLEIKGARSYCSS